MKADFYLLLAATLLTGCATLPFPEPPPCVPASAATAYAIPGSFAARVAPRFEQVNAVVFVYRMRRLAALGLVAVDRPARAFSVSCVTPLGVKIFDVVATNGAATARFVNPALAARGGNLAQAVADDLARAYFDWAPPPGTPGAFRRETPAGHVTGSAWLVNRAGTHVLLTHHRKLGRWLQLGGHAYANARTSAIVMKPGSPSPCTNFSTLWFKGTIPWPSKPTSNWAARTNASTCSWAAICKATMGRSRSASLPCPCWKAWTGLRKCPNPWAIMWASPKSRARFSASSCPFPMS